MNVSRRYALVTGASGFLGGRLARRLHADGWEVTGLGRNMRSGQMLEREGIRFVQADLLDTTRAMSACRKHDIVFHCAARSSPWGALGSFYRDNVIGTRSVVAGCKAHSVRRLIHVSTPSIYFDFSDRLNVSESQPPARHPANHYVRTKLLAEAEVDAASASMEVITLRPRAIFGPGDRTLFPRLIRANGPRGFPLIGENDPMMDISFVDNVVDALICAAGAPKAALGRKYNITNGEPWARSRLLATLFQEVGIPFRVRPIGYAAAHSLATILELGSQLLTLGRWEPPLTRYTVGVLAKSQTLDISAARELLGYQPHISVADGLRQFAVWWKREGKNVST